MLILACSLVGWAADDELPAEPAEAAPAPEPAVPPAPAPEPAEAEAPESGEASLMVGHFVDATTIMLAVAVGRVDVARAHADTLAHATGADDTLVAAAQAVVDCKKVSCAAPAVGQLGSACASCHLEAGKGPVPHDMGTIPGKDARERHIYAATFAWVGLVTPKQPTLLMGLSNVVPPVDRASSPKPVVEAADAFRERITAAVAAESLEDRATAFGGVLEACAACHAQTLDERARSGR